MAFLGQVPVPSRLHRHVGAGAAGHEDRLDEVHPLDGAVGDRLERDLASAAEPLVGGDHDLRAGVDDAIAQRLGAEAAEHHRVHRADAGAGQHRVGRLGDHRHVDADPVALADAELQQDVRHPRDLVLQLPIGDVPVDARLVRGPDDRGLFPAFGHVPVDAVVACVEAAAAEPAEVDFLVVGVEDHRPRVVPGQPLRLLRPEPLRVVEREPVEPLVLFHRVDVGAGAHRFLDVVDFAHGPAPGWGIRGRQL